MRNPHGFVIKPWTQFLISFSFGLKLTTAGRNHIDNVRNRYVHISAAVSPPAHHQLLPPLGFDDGTPPCYLNHNTHQPFCGIYNAKGDSMADAGIDEDDLLVIERNCPALEGDIVVALDEDNQNTLKRYAGYDEDSGYYILEYENKARYPGKTIKVRSFQVQGVARHVIKSL